MRSPPNPTPATVPILGSSTEPTRIVRELGSDDLFQGQKTLVIRHGGEIYRLSVTRNNRLILQK